MKLVDKKICNGCGACNNVCPVGAIDMMRDKEGFEYPIISDEKCINCYKCEHVCPVKTRYNPHNSYPVPEVYAAWSLDEEIRINSTSGGIFSELAKVILEKKGVVVGAKYNKDHQVQHHMIYESNQLEQIRQSKYVQSKIDMIYKEIKACLNSGRDVLFCGTPCQNAALSKYLDKKYENLILCDFICRGVNSPKVYGKYLEMLKESYQSQVKKVHFKNKTFGWNRFSTKIYFDNGNYYLKDRNEDLYMIGYIKENLYMRPSCHNCMYKGVSRVSDITLGDFWGIGRTRKHLDEDKGTSVVLINTEKGKKIFNQLNIFSEKSSLQEVISGNPCLEEVVEPSSLRESFFEDIDELNFLELMNKYCKR